MILADRAVIVFLVFAVVNFGMQLLMASKIDELCRRVNYLMEKDQAE